MLQYITRTAANGIASAVEKHPALGYTGAGVSVGGGVAGMSFIETATKIGGLVSVIVGIAVGIVTLIVQIRVLRQRSTPGAASTPKES